MGGRIGFWWPIGLGALGRKIWRRKLALSFFPKRGFRVRKKELIGTSSLSIGYEFLLVGLGRFLGPNFLPNSFLKGGLLETGFNLIWGLQRGRPFLNKISPFISLGSYFKGFGI